MHIQGFGDGPQVDFLKTENKPRGDFWILRGFDIQNQCLLYAKTPCGILAWLQKTKNATTLRTHFACQIVAIDFEIYALIISAESKNLNGKTNPIAPKPA